MTLKRLGVYLTYPFGREDRPHYNAKNDILFLAFTIPVVALAAVGLLRGLRRVAAVRLLAACAIGMAIGFALTYVGDLRYRQGFDLFLFPVAGLAGAQILLQVWTRRGPGQRPA